MPDDIVNDGAPGCNGSRGGDEGDGALAADELVGGLEQVRLPLQLLCHDDQRKTYQ